MSTDIDVVSRYIDQHTIRVWPCQTYTIRPALVSDSRFIYELSMDPRIREMSTRSDEFTFEDHERWYAEKLADGLNAIWIMEVGGLSVAQVRYGRVLGNCLLHPPPLLCATDMAEISIMVVPHEWRRGYALALLQETMPLAREWLKVSTLVALVLRTNYASRKLFRWAGFRYVGVECRMDKIHGRYEK